MWIEILSKSVIGRRSVILIDEMLEWFLIFALVMSAEENSIQQIVL